MMACDVSPVAMFLSNLVARDEKCLYGTSCFCIVVVVPRICITPNLALTRFFAFFVVL